jgi:hypothetical protein
MNKFRGLQSFNETGMYFKKQLKKRRLSAIIACILSVIAGIIMVCSLFDWIDDNNAFKFWCIFMISGLIIGKKDTE